MTVDILLQYFAESLSTTAIILKKNCITQINITIKFVQAYTQYSFQSMC